ncbi:MAG TPA: imidazolonepropionase [Thermoplasmata archaeon]|nr:imidazolonepropionase [Thermoplasmata archaeon]
MISPRAHKVRATRGERPARSLLVVHAGELLTLRGPMGPRIRATARDLGMIEDGAVYAEGDRLVAVGETPEVLASHPQADVRLDASGRVVLPGFVDPHTHAIFAGSREREVEWKSQGLGYREIASRGGGILETVRATREASEEDLGRSGADRLATMMRHGTTTAEVKSGYGLCSADEAKILRAAARAGELAGLDVVRTFLGAHAVPPEHAGDRAGYLDLVAGEMLDTIAHAKLAAFCDIFVDEGYFTVDEGRRLLTKGKGLGLRPKLHADELSDSGGGSLAAEVGAASADHLLRVSASGVEEMARHHIPGVLLPATSLTSRLPYADGRRLIDAGVPVALGTDFNPNCWCESMQLAIALACHHNGLLPAEAIVAGTINAAHAIGRATEIGSLEPGKLADLLILEVPSFRHLGYRIGGNIVHTVVKRGRVRIDRALTK